MVEEAAPEIVGSTIPNIAEAHLTQTDRRRINTPVLAIDPGRPSDREVERPIDREAVQPIDREVERPSDREVEQPIDREAEQPIDREAERPSGREAERPIGREAGPPIDPAAEVRALGQRLARPTRTRSVTGKFPRVPVPAIEAPLPALRVA